MDKLKLDVGFGVLVAEIYKNTAAGDRDQQEISITLEDHDGNMIQDIALISQAVDPQTWEAIPDAVRCLVWADHLDENYTHEHVIEKYTGED